MDPGSKPVFVIPDKYMKNWKEPPLSKEKVQEAIDQLRNAGLPKLSKAPKTNEEQKQGGEWTAYALVCRIV